MSSTDHAVKAQQRSVELRLAERDDADQVRRLAILDEDTELNDPVLLAIVDGVAVAGLSLVDRRVVADPFVATAQTVALMRLRAEHLAPAPPRRSSLRLRR